MRVLIVGGAGMLGHRLFLGLSPKHEVRVTLHGAPANYVHLGIFSPANAYFSVDVCQIEALSVAIDDFRPDAIVNAVGIVKQRAGAEQPVPSIMVNSLYPHRLAELAAKAGARVVHFSTDCVFSGRRGSYTETDVPDPVDLYGRSKVLGEVHGPGCTTIRTSIIGLELATRQGLVEWFLSQSGTPVNGYRRAVFSGITTREAARLVESVLAAGPYDGLWHVASTPMSKFDLLTALAAKLERTDIVIEPSDALRCDRSLNADALADATGFRSRSWSEMLDELVGDIRQREGQLQTR